jgi:hypothetical protein
MAEFRITETVVYIVDADDAQHAEEILEQAYDMDEFFVGTESRKVEEIQWSSTT